MTSKRPIKRPSRQTAYDRIRLIIEKARGNVARAVNTEIVMAYSHIGKEIVEEEQNGKKRAEYGKKLIENLSLRLSEHFGKGFDGRNLFYMRQFYLAYPKLNALSSQLSWTHYRILMRVDNPGARTFYMEESIANNWSARELERQKGSLLYERLVLSKEKKALRNWPKKGRNWLVTRT